MAALGCKGVFFADCIALFVGSGGLGSHCCAKSEGCDPVLLLIGIGGTCTSDAISLGEGRLTAPEPDFEVFIPFDARKLGIFCPAGGSFMTGAFGCGGSVAVIKRADISCLLSVACERFVCAWGSVSSSKSPFGPGSTRTARVALAAATD